MISAFHIELEELLLFHPEFIFSDDQLAEFQQQLISTDTTSFETKQFMQYLHGIIACYQDDYLQAHHILQMVDSTVLPKHSHYFWTIYSTVAECLFTPDNTAKLLEKLRNALPSEYFCYLLTQLVIMTHKVPEQHARSFYLNLQLLELIPSLPSSNFTAQIYYEIGYFYLMRTQNVPLAQIYLEKTLQYVDSHDLSHSPLAKLCWISLAYCASFNFDEQLTNSYYDRLLDLPYNGDIDELYYNRALLNAISIAISTKDVKRQAMLWNKVHAFNTSDAQKKRSVLFTLYYIKIYELISQPTLDDAKLAELQTKTAAIVPLLVPRLAATRPDIMWSSLEGQILIKQHQYSQAIAKLEYCIALSEQHQQYYSLAFAHDLLSRFYESQKQFKLALTHAEKSAKIKSDLFHEHNHYYLTSIISEFDTKNLEVQIISNRDEKDTLQQLVFKDQLTSLHNRRYLEELVSQLAHDEPLQVAMIDIDFFKRYNDFYGHLKGDQLLANFAMLLKKCLTEYDIVRYGGEEFLVIGKSQSPQLFKRALSDFQVQLSHKNYAHHGIDETARVTASIGYTYVASNEYSLITDDFFKIILEQADTALYAAKGSGRNTCMNYKDLSH